MLRLPFEAFLALRYLRPRRTVVSVITVISILGVMLGVAVLIVVLAVMSGFDQEWRKTILGFQGHLKVFNGAEGEYLTNYGPALKLISSNSMVAGVSPFLASQVVAKTEPDPNAAKPQWSVPWLMGVDPNTIATVNGVRSNMTEGVFDFSDKGIVIGIDYAAENRLTVGDRLAVYSFSSLEKAQSLAGQTNAEAPIAEEYTVRGIFHAGFPEFNRNYVLASLEDARDLFDLPRGTALGLQIKLRDPFQAMAVSNQLKPGLPQGWVVETWERQNAIFQALATEKEMMFYVLFFIMIVAAFGIVNCQITFVMQKTREIGILKALGASDRRILVVFLSQSVVVGVLGVGLGLATAMLALHYREEFLNLMRHVTGSDLLPRDIYEVYKLPASIETADVVRICGAALLACVLAGIFPAWKASRLQPVEALRHE